MIINSIQIKKFRGFDNVSFDLGKNLTVIAGQNGTQKTTLIGMLSQPFSISNKTHPMYGEKPLTGGNYRSSFAEKFKLSETFDNPKGHEWTLLLNDAAEPSFTIQSIARNGHKGHTKSPEIRFWRKGIRAKGSGYIQRPVLYLSLSRLFPIGEDSNINSSSEVILSDAEFKFFNNWHNKILIIPNGDMTSADYLVSKQKNTLGVNTSYYDWKMNSAGQDNIGKILLAILSFKRLSEKYGDDYSGGILAIDELDTTLYPASQLKLLEALRKFSSQYRIQIIFTTHSLTILEKSCEWQEDSTIQGQIKVIYLQKIDVNVAITENIPFTTIKDKLNVVLSLKKAAKKVPVFTEDKEGAIFLKALIKSRSSDLEFLDCTLGCDHLVELVRKKIPGFKYPQSLIFLDGDVKKKQSKIREIKRINSPKKNILLLPGNNSPERLIADFLNTLSDSSPIWERIHSGYNKQIAFSDFSLSEIFSDRDKAKLWFNKQKPYWGKLCNKVINPWISANQQEVDLFITEFEKTINSYKKLTII